MSGRISATGHSLSVRRSGGKARGLGDCRSFSFESTDAGNQAIVAEHEPEPQPEPETASEFRGARGGMPRRKASKHVTENSSFLFQKRKMVKNLNKNLKRIARESKKVWKARELQVFEGINTVAELLLTSTSFMSCGIWSTMRFESSQDIPGRGRARL